MLNVDVGSSKGDDGERPDRQTLVDRLLDELTAPGVHDWVRRLRSWPGGPISLLHLSVLLALRADGPLSMRAVAELADVSEASATGIVDRMEQRGLVERRHDTQDRRVVLVHLTERGRGVLAALDVARRLHLAHCVDKLTDQELAGLVTGLRALRAARERLTASQPEEGPR
jgi:DNA-binding MarR family transcriptional regulator